jgi:superfamily II DNA or RNA helicase
MSYKSTILSQKYKWNNNFLNYGTLKITNIQTIQNNGYASCKKPFVFDIEVEQNHNFVIGTKIKSSKQKEYLDGPVVSNCHHISSQVFSRCLPKLGCKYSLGLSATPKRKDGLSKVFHWYIGPTIFNITKRDEMKVIVECIEFTSTNKEYTKEELSSYGKISMPKMINNVCAYMKRTLFLVELIKLCVKENRKILFLSDRRAHLTDIYEIVTYKNICPVGYYVGGMKQSERKISEGRQLMLGTYTMAAEGLDVKTLNTIIFGSPKSDITQSIGRILRQKNPNIVPKAYDLIDKSMTVFERQFYKRQRFYKRNKYIINKTPVVDLVNNTASDLGKQYISKQAPEQKDPHKELLSNITKICMI